MSQRALLKALLALSLMALAGTTASAQDAYIGAYALQWTYEELDNTYEALAGQGSAGVRLNPYWAAETRVAGGGSGSDGGVQIELDWSFTTLLRPMVAIHPSAKIYGLLGATGFRVEQNESGGGYAALEPSYGAGFEWRFRPKTWAQLEYMSYSGDREHALDAASIGVRWFWR